MNNREYVLASNKHRTGDILLFWGKYTQDNEKRSFGGYYADLEVCERYSEEDMKIRPFPILDNTSSEHDLWHTEHYYIKVEHLINHKNATKQTTVRWL